MTILPLIDDFVKSPQAALLSLITERTSGDKKIDPERPWIGD